MNNNFNQFMSYAGIYCVSSSNVSIVNNEIEGFNFGILGIFTKNFQISDNKITNSSAETQLFPYAYRMGRDHKKMEIKDTLNI